MVSSILKYSDLYHKKIAGLLKAPVHILEQAQTWACGAYCWHLLKPINSVIKQSEERNAQWEIINDLINQWDIGIDIIKNLQNTGIEPLLEWLGSNKFLYNLRPSPLVDYHTDYTINGVLYDNKYDLFLSVRPLPNGEYILHLYITDPDNAVPVNIKKTYNENQVIQSLNYYLIVIEEMFQTFSQNAKSFYVYDENFIKKMKAVQIECTKYTQSGEIQGTLEATYFTLSFSPEELPYFSEKSALKGKELAINFKFLTNAEEAKKVYNEENWLGLYQPHQILGTGKKIYLGSIYLARLMKKEFQNIAEEPEYLFKRLIDLKRTTRHELQHFMQHVLQKSYRSDDTEFGYEGLPSKNIRDRLFNPHGYRLPTYQGKSIDLAQPRLPHAERDIEFYTRLSDNISEFNNEVKNIPLTLHKLYARAWIGDINTAYFDQKMVEFLQNQWDQSGEIQRNYNNVDEFIVAERRRYNWNLVLQNKNVFFVNLKVEQPAKWRKAVKEFLKAIDL